MKTALVSVGSAILFFAIGFFVATRLQVPATSLPMMLQPTPIPTPLAVYSFDHLSQTKFTASPIVLGDVISETKTSIMQSFSYSFAPRPGDQSQKKVTGVINVPKAPGTYPLIVMMRGYIPLASYKPGAGTQPSASVFVNHGYITIAPDFLGYGGSDARSDDPYEARFQTYTTALSLISSLSSLNSSFDASYSGTIRIDPSKISIWGHSNGGHIALATLASSGVTYPTVLWAPVSKSFPYSVLAYTDEDDDGGRAERKDLARFESLYDTTQFDPAANYQNIKAPLSIYQGTADIEVPFWWSDDLVKSLKKNDITVEYHVFPGSDHNLRPAWNDVVNTSIEFYDKQFSK